MTAEAPPAANALSPVPARFFVSAHLVHSARPWALELFVRFHTNVVRYRLRSKLVHCDIAERKHSGIRRPPYTPSHLDL
jgi:hypothetical protein